MYPRLALNSVPSASVCQGLGMVTGKTGKVSWVWKKRWWPQRETKLGVPMTSFLPFSQFPGHPFYFSVDDGFKVVKWNFLPISNNEAKICLKVKEHQKQSLLKTQPPSQQRDRDFTSQGDFLPGLWLIKQGKCRACSLPTLYKRSLYRMCPLAVGIRARKCSSAWVIRIKWNEWNWPHGDGRRKEPSFYKKETWAPSPPPTAAAATACTASANKNRYQHSTQTGWSKVTRVLLKSSSEKVKHVN